MRGYFKNCNGRLNCFENKSKDELIDKQKNVELIDPLLVKTELVGLFAFPSLFFHFIFSRHNLYFVHHHLILCFSALSKEDRNAEAVKYLRLVVAYDPSRKEFLDQCL